MSHIEYCAECCRCGTLIRLRSDAFLNVKDEYSVCNDYPHLCIICGQALVWMRADVSVTEKLRSRHRLVLKRRIRYLKSK